MTSGCSTGNTGLLLPLDWGLCQQLLRFLGLGFRLEARSQISGSVDGLQMVGCGTSQPPQSLKSIPYDMSPFCLSGEPLRVHRGKGQLQAMENMTLVT